MINGSSPHSHHLLISYSFECRRCDDGGRQEQAEVRNEIQIESEGMVESVSKFCCVNLVDMTGSEDGAEEASTDRMRREWVIVL